MDNPEVVTYHVLEVSENNLFDLEKEEAELGMLVDSIYEITDEPTPSTSADVSHTRDAFEEVEVFEPMEYTTQPYDSPDDLRISESDDNDSLHEEEEEAKRMHDLTQQYLTGKMTFSEYLRGTDVYEEDQHDDSDEDYDPHPPKRKPKPKHSADAFCEEFDATSRSRASRKSKANFPRVRRVLPPVLSNLLGQANLKYAQDEKDIAIQICEEIIRQVPQAASPYKLLALIHRERGNIALAHHYSLIAAHLSPQSSDEWVHLAETSLELGERDQAMTCLSQAIKRDKYNTDPRLRQIKLLQSIGESKAAQRARERMVETLCSSHKVTQQHGRLILLQAKIAAREFHQENNLPRATKIMERAITACKSSALQDDIHLLVELHCEQNENMKGLNILQRECSVQLQPQEPPFISCICPDTLASDLRAKLIVFLVRLDINSEILLNLMQPFIEGNPDEQGDLYLDIVEALMAKNRYDEAMFLLEPLVSCEMFSLAAVWLTHGECLRNLGKLETAVISYENVMKLAPQHVQARLTLSSLLCQLERYEEALSVLHSKDPEPRLLYEEFHLLSQTQPDRAIDLAIVLISQYVRMDKLKEMYDTKRRISLIERIVENGPTKEELYFVISKASESCLKYKLYEKFKKLAYIALHVRPLLDFKKEFEFLCVISAIYAKDINLSWLLVRDILINYKYSVNAWNIFGLAVKYPEESKHTRFVTRLLNKNPSNWAPGICYANNCFIAGGYKDALVEFGSRHKVSPSPYCALLIGISWAHIACQKKATDKQTSVIQAKAFLEEYARLRGSRCNQEVMYNMGRAMHHLGLTELAMHFYNKALSHKSSSPLLDLSKEIAFNLALMYRTSGNNMLARKIINTYITI